MTLIIKNKVAIAEVDKDEVSQLIKEVKELKNQHKKGERKGYGSMKEFRKELENIKKEADKMLKDYKAGKLKAFDDINELRAELEK